MTSWHSILPWQELQQCREREFTLATGEIDDDDGENVELAGFVVCYEQQAFAYINRCPHQQVYLNWSPHQFFDRERALLVCSTHGAIFRPGDGLCVAGPCAGRALVPLDTRINAGQVQVSVA